MSTEIRVTPDLPKLCESAARNCYNSFHLSKPDSHNLVKTIMNMPKPHLSIGHHGNILICINMPEGLTVAEIKIFDVELYMFLQDLHYSSNGYLNITTTEQFPDSEHEAVVSGNPVAWKKSLEFVKERIDDQDERLMIVYERLYKGIVDKLETTPETMFFFLPDEGYAIKENPYNITDNTFETKRNKILVFDNFRDLLTEEECEVHETATVVIKTSRDMSMQMNRHEGGISQLSQRYVFPFDMEGDKWKEFLEKFNQEVYNKVQFEFFEPIGVDIEDSIPLQRFIRSGERTINFDNNGLLWESEITYKQAMDLMKTLFFAVMFDQIEKGEKPKRANEIARSLLPNNMGTTIYYTRTKRGWGHYLYYRTDNHTQPEARRETIPLLESFQKECGWFKHLIIDKEKLTAKLKGE